MPVKRKRIETPKERIKRRTEKTQTQIKRNRKISQKIKDMRAGDPKHMVASVDDLDALPRQLGVADLQEGQRLAAEEARQMGANALEAVVEYWMLGMKGLRRKYIYDEETGEVKFDGMAVMPEWAQHKSVAELANRCGLPQLKEVRAQFEVKNAPVQVYAFPDPFGDAKSPVLDGEFHEVLEAGLEDEKELLEGGEPSGEPPHTESGEPPQEPDDN